MRNLLSSLFFVLIFVALGAMAFAAAPRGQEAAQPAVAPALELQAQDDLPTAPEAPTAAKYNAIAMTLDSTDTIPDAQALATEIAGTQMVLQWIASTQTFDFWIPPSGPGTNFSLEVGRPYMVQVDSSAPSTFTVVGDVPPQTGQPGAVQFDMLGGSPCKYNFISVPLDHASVTDAQSLADSISTTAGDVEQVLVWKPDTGTFDFWIPPSGPGTNFSAQIGYPYFVCLSTNITWP
jgi:hypothetical protein